jgi:hypothetical protein
MERLVKVATPLLGNVRVRDSWKEKSVTNVS